VQGRSEARHDFFFAAASGDEGFDETIRVTFSDRLGNFAVLNLAAARVMLAFVIANREGVAARYPSGLGSCRVMARRELGQ
jgi:hypothetical protein